MLLWNRFLNEKTFNTSTVTFKQIISLNINHLKWLENLDFYHIKLNRFDVVQKTLRW